MGATTLISVEEYLASTYRPDKEYLSGVLLECNMGERDHSRPQTDLSTWLNRRSKMLQAIVLVEQRVQVNPDRFRVPDICVVDRESPEGQIITHPPVLCIEILSRSDTMGEMQERIDDYLRFGVPEVWVWNPRSRKVWIYTAEGAHEVKEPAVRSKDGRIEVPLADIFTE